MSIASHQRRVWQLASGSGSRDYSATFLRCGVGLIGPGWVGRWTPEASDERFEGSFVRNFVTQVSEGDVMLLRASSKEVLAVGLVASEYQYLEQFDDVNGWDLQQARRVRWFRLPTPYCFETPVFGPRPSRFSGVYSDEAIRFAFGIADSPPDDWKTATLPELPPVEPALLDPPEELRDIIGSVQDLATLYRDRRTLGGWPLEAELVCHCAVPFLLALGWSRLHIAIEWQNIDIAVFRALPREPDNCRFVIEAKNFGEGIEGASSQAKGYMDRLGIRCSLVVTDGIRYKLYDPDNLNDSVAYANLWEPKQSAIDLFSRLRRNNNA
jgi:hypothetical protein